MIINLTKNLNYNFKFVICQVVTLDGAKSIQKLKTGDAVLTASGFEPVLGWLHQNKNSDGMQFIEVTHANGVLTLTADHVVYTADGSAMTANSLNVGMELAGANGSIEINAVKKVGSENGLYAPWIASGTIVVDGVVASTMVDSAHQGGLASLRKCFFNISGFLLHISTRMRFFSFKFVLGSMARSVMSVGAQIATNAFAGAEKMVAHSLPVVTEL